MRNPFVGQRVKALVAGLAIAAAASACAPSASSSAASCPAPSSPPAGVISDIYRDVNADRAANGRAPLRWNPQLFCLANDWSNQMAASGSLRHRDLNVVIRSAGYESYRTLGENILRGPRSMSGAAMEDAWMASTTHRANILSGAFTSIGISYRYSPDGTTVYATQNFGG